jgi:hypothetical protein
MKLGESALRGAVIGCGGALPSTHGGDADGNIRIDPVTEELLETAGPIVSRKEMKLIGEVGEKPAALPRRGLLKAERMF